MDSEIRVHLGIVHSFCRSAKSGAVDITDFTCIALMVYIHAYIHTSLIAGGSDAPVEEVLMLLRALYDFSSFFWCHGVWFAPIMILPNETDQCVVLIGRES